MIGKAPSQDVFTTTFVTLPAEVDEIGATFQVIDRDSYQVDEFDVKVLDKSTTLCYNVVLMSETKVTSTHGGKRSGAGRPKQSSVAAVTKSNEIVERKLKTLAEQGWEVLADSHPDIMRKAVRLALDDDKPDKGMIKTLLELMVKVVGSEPEQKESVISALVENFRDRLQEADRASRPVVVSDSEGRDVEVDRRDAPGAGADPVVSGVVGSIRVDGVD